MSFYGRRVLTVWKLRYIFETIEQDQLKRRKSMHYMTLGITKLKIPLPRQHLGSEISSSIKQNGMFSASHGVKVYFYLACNFR